MMTPKILFFTAVLFASAVVGYPANEIDWGKGRPGVRVVTNAPSRAEFDALVSGNGQYASVAASASNALRAVAITGPQSNVIASAGVHTNRTDNPHAVTAAQVGAPSIEALYTLMATSKIDRIWEGTNAWWTFVSNTLIRTELAATNGWVLQVHEQLYDHTSADQAIADVGTYLLPQIPSTLPESDEYATAIPPYGPTITITGSGASIDIAVYWTNTNLVSDLTTYDLLPIPGAYSGWATLYYAGSGTNATIYYLQTNLVPPETWSYADHTNWVSEGGVGEQWITDITTTLWWTYLNAHVGYANAHPQYAKITGASLTNAVLVGGNAITTNMLPFAGCRDMGATNAIVIDGSHVYYRAAPSSGYSVTVSVSAASGRTYCLTTYSTSAVSYAANISLRNSWTAGGTNTMVFYPGETNSWFVKGSAP